MPGENNKGPLGEGPRTGRGLGRCNPRETDDQNVNDQQDAPRGLGRSLGRGQGGAGRGLGRGPGRGSGRGPGRGRGFGRGNF